jgi:hypothetical protein
MPRMTPEERHMKQLKENWPPKSIRLNDFLVTIWCVVFLAEVPDNLCHCLRAINFAVAGVIHRSYEIPGIPGAEMYLLARFLGTRIVDLLNHILVNESNPVSPQDEEGRPLKNDALFNYLMETTNDDSMAIAIDHKLPSFGPAILVLTQGSIDRGVAQLCKEEKFETPEPGTKMRIIMEHMVGVMHAISSCAMMVRLWFGENSEYATEFQEIKTEFINKMMVAIRQLDESKLEKVHKCESVISEEVLTRPFTQEYGDYMQDPKSFFKNPHTGKFERFVEDLYDMGEWLEIYGQREIPV